MRSRSYASILGIGILAGVIPACDTDLRFDAPDAGGGSGAAETSDSHVTGDGPSGLDAATCHADADCPLTTLHCDTASGARVACLVNADRVATGGLNRCETTRRACVDFSAESDCPTSDRCLTEVHACIPRCSATNKCIASTSRCDVPSAGSTNVQRKAGTTHITGTATSGSATYAIDVTK